MDSETVTPELEVDLSGRPDSDKSSSGDRSQAFGKRETRIRWIFLAFSIVSGAIAAYTTRHFVNGDALVYFDMADAIDTRRWADLINFHYSPGYAVLLGLADKLFGAGTLDELYVAKVVNFVCFLITLLALEILLARLKVDEDFGSSTRYRHLDWLYFRAAAYGVFLVCALVYVRIQVVSPDMLEFCFALLALASLVWIKKSGDSYAKFVVLGVVAGIGYIFKTPFFLMSMVFLGLSACYATSVSRAVTRVLTAAIVFLTIGASVWLPMSDRLGRFSFGESGSFNYTYFVSGAGKPVHVPEKVWDNPHVEVYSGGSPAATYPRGFDLAYWNEGVKPTFELQSQVPVLAKNVLAVLGLNPWLHLVFLAWLCLHVRMGSSFAVKLRKPSLPVLFGIVALAGTGLFCLVLVEARYVAPYVFAGLVALLLWPRCAADRPQAGRAVRAGVVLITTFSLVTTVVSICDHASRSLNHGHGKQSHRSVFLENTAIRDFLQSRGVSGGDLAGILGSPSVGIYWARLTRVKAVATIADERAFLAATRQEREGAVNALRERRFKVIVGTGNAIADLKQEGWCPVPGTVSSYALFLQ
jgi:hypothetical protein